MFSRKDLQKRLYMLTRTFASLLKELQMSLMAREPEAEAETEVLLKPEQLNRRSPYWLPR